MTHILRHTAVRLWASLLAGTMAVLWLLPVLSARVDLVWAAIAVTAGLVLTFFLLGWIFNRAALAMIERLFREGTIWERAGNFRRAEKIFKKAIALFDSFLVSPSVRRNKSKHLATHLARFYLTRRDRDHAAESYLNAYLHRYPHEDALAEEWLQQTLLQDDLTADQQELAHRIGEAQPENFKIQLLLARFYAVTERTDYQALQCYRRILEKDTALDAALASQLAELFYQDRRTDVWAMKAYLSAHAGNPQKKHLMAGVAACLHRIRADTLPADLRQDAEALLSRVGEEERREMSAGFAPPTRLVAPSPPPATDRLNQIRDFLRGFIRATGAFTRLLASLVSSLQDFFTRLYRRIRDYRHLRTLLKWGAIGLAALGFVVLAANTVTFLVKPKPEIPIEEPPPPVVVTDPFTLQVAAYIKKEHALKYVEELKDLGLDAYWTEAKGIKSQWYQVRLSHFPDKASARTYGESLKSKGIIDDFYVANYQRP